MPQQIFDICLCCRSLHITFLMAVTGASQTDVLEAEKSRDTTCTSSRHQFCLLILCPAVSTLTGLTVKIEASVRGLVTYKWPLWSENHLSHMTVMVNDFLAFCSFSVC